MFRVQASGLWVEGCGTSGSRVYGNMKGDCIRSCIGSHSHSMFRIRSTLRLLGLFWAFWGKVWALGAKVWDPILKVQEP